ncbi:helix-turn-helix transcriptional regulator [Clostridium estertheticum]|uniref:winged helix-turn-helix transcriptional regulator n=1 Tax=Clostridium estertheticum TaxID=238834 RepID=UPI001C0CD17E|nr:helix-turn-helix domain-containing protein [Clostridium estertheticum]MBU3199231.1 helix-turn-helix transcriptional regulator [Clostridium estertheticum]WAG67518.1 helix-turn-helix transcriptional regulator [Clostridium estertheticum]
MNDNIGYKVGLTSDNVYETKCPIIYALDIVGQKWKLPIMWYLFENETTRYNELKRKVKGITYTMLTKSLQELEAHELVIRTQYETIPPKVEYSLTERGKELLPTLNELYRWGEKQIELDN